jgi:hypothetical protein
MLPDGPGCTSSSRTLHFPPLWPRRRRRCTALTCTNNESGPRPASPAELRDGPQTAQLHAEPPQAQRGHRSVSTQCSVMVAFKPTASTRVTPWLAVGGRPACPPPSGHESDSVERFEPGPRDVHSRSGPVAVDPVRLHADLALYGLHSLPAGSWAGPSRLRSPAHWLRCRSCSGYTGTVGGARLG